MGRGLWILLSLTKRKTEMDFTKFDFSQFDVTKLLDATQAIEHMEKNTKSVIAFVPDAKSREFITAITDASLEFARSQALATKLYADAVKQAIKI